MRNTTDHRTTDTHAAEAITARTAGAAVPPARGGPDPEEAGIQADALLDLFLGPDPIDSIRADDPVAGVPFSPISRGTSHDLPAGVAHPPTPRVRPATTPPGPVADRTPRAAARAVIEAVLVGHLPVLGSAWVATYARQRSESLGEPVGLIRLSGGEVAVDLIHPSGGMESVSAACGESKGPLEPNGARTTTQSPVASSNERMLREAIARAIDVTHWLLRVDPAEADDIEVRGLADSITILSGADDAAVVSTYQTLKRLLESECAKSGDVRDLGSPMTNRTYSVALMGSDRAKAEAAAQKLRGAVLAFLGRTVTTRVCDRRISGGGGLELLRGPWSDGVPALIATLRRTTEAPREVHRVSLRNDPTTIHSAEPTRPEHDRSFEIDRVIFSRPGSTPDASSFTPNADAHKSRDSRIRSRPTTQSPQNGARPPLADPEPTGQDFDQTLVNAAATHRNDSAASASPMEILPGIRAVELTCPYAPSVRFGLDADGRLNLVGDASDLAGLLAASSWTAAHAGLITRSVGPFLRLDAGSPARLHALTEQPDVARPLLDGDITVHLLVRIDTPGGVVSTTRRLNSTCR